MVGSLDTAIFPHQAARSNMNHEVRGFNHFPKTCFLCQKHGMEPVVCLSSFCSNKKTSTLNTSCIFFLCAARRKGEGSSTEYVQTLKNHGDKLESFELRALSWTSNKVNPAFMSVMNKTRLANLTFFYSRIRGRGVSKQRRDGNTTSSLLVLFCENIICSIKNKRGRAILSSQDPLFARTISGYFVIKNTMNILESLPWTCWWNKPSKTPMLVFMEKKHIHKNSLIQPMANL